MITHVCALFAAPLLSGAVPAKLQGNQRKFVITASAVQTASQRSTTEQYPHLLLQVVWNSLPCA